GVVDQDVPNPVAPPDGCAAILFLGSRRQRDARPRRSSNLIRGNLISANSDDGIIIDGNNNIVSGNLIGTDASGTLPLGNGSNGVTIFSGSGNRIGSSLNPQIFLFEGNRIAFNGTNGVVVGGFGASPLQNSILSNSIFSNGLLGIHLGFGKLFPGDGVT